MASMTRSGWSMSIGGFRGERCGRYDRPPFVAHGSRSGWFIGRSRPFDPIVSFMRIGGFK